MQVLSVEECWRLLGTQTVGRLGVVVVDRPMIFPVNFVLDGFDVVIRTGAGTKLANASLSRVCFETDVLDRERSCGWSVLVQGIGRVVTDAVDPASVRQQGLDITTWDPSAKPELLRIIHPEISGRRLLPS